MAELLMWVADLREVAQPEPFREPGCMSGLSRRPSRRCCDYHRADWHAISGLVVPAMRESFGDQAAPLGDAMSALAVQMDRRFAGRRRRLTRLFAYSLLLDPLHATKDEWTNGQTRARAMLDAGVALTLFAG